MMKTLRFGFLLSLSGTLAFAATPTAPARAPQGPPANAAQAADELQVAESQYAALDYGPALAGAERVLTGSGLSSDIMVRATRLAAYCAAALGNSEQAKQAFIALLYYKPDFKIDPKLGSRFQDAFAEARGFAQAQSKMPGMEVTVSVQDSQPGLLRVTLRDPSNTVRKVRIGYRWAPEKLYKVDDVDTASPQVDMLPNPATSLRLEYYVVALDKRTNAVFEAGSEKAPVLHIVTRAAAQAEKKSSIFASPVFWIVGGAVVAGAATAGFFAFRPTSFQSPTAARAGFVARCGDAVCD
jgi:hypothetical protein